MKKLENNLHETIKFSFPLFEIISLSLGIYKYAGQNLGQMKSSAKYSTPENAIKTVIKGWFDEHNDANMTFIEKFRHSE